MAALACADVWETFEKRDVPGYGVEGAVEPKKEEGRWPHGRDCGPVYAWLGERKEGKCCNGGALVRCVRRLLTLSINVAGN